MGAKSVVGAKTAAVALCLSFLGLHCLKDLPDELKSATAAPYFPLLGKATLMDLLMELNPKGMNGLVFLAGDTRRMVSRQCSESQACYQNFYTCPLYQKQVWQK